MKLCLIFVFLSLILRERKYDTPVVGGDQLINRCRLFYELPGLGNCLGITGTVKGTLRNLISGQIFKPVHRIGHYSGHRGCHLHKRSACLLHDTVQIAQRIKIRILQNRRLQGILQIIGIFKFLIAVTHGKGRKLTLDIT